jgi:hypothetical protein
MKRLSESLEGLATRVAVLEDSATAAFEADRAKLEHRHQEIEATVNGRIDEMESAIQDAAVAGRTWWKDTRASMARPFDDLRARHDKRQSEHELRRALRDAEDAEQDAAAAIDLAAYFLNVAELAVVDAALARLAADDLAAAPTGAGVSAPTVGATS